MLGPKLIEPPGECRSNHDVLVGLAKRGSAPRIAGFDMTPARDHRLDARRNPAGARCDRLEEEQMDRLPARFRDGALSSTASPIRTASSNSSRTGRPCPRAASTTGASRTPCRDFPTTGTSTRRPMRSIPSGSRPRPRAAISTPRSTRCHRAARAKASRAPRCIPTIWQRSASSTAQKIRMGNERGEILPACRELRRPPARASSSSKAIPPNDDFEGGEGLNTLTSAERIAPFGGAAFHDNHVWIKGA